MTYCISDIHGCYFEFMELLEKINFGEGDTLYILGDIIDRGAESMECLEYAYQAKNIISLMGNHEKMMLNYFPKNGRKKDSFWLAHGGDKFLRQIEDAEYDDESKRQWKNILKWVRTLPLYAEVDVNDRKYFLSHAGLYARKPYNKQEETFFIWGSKNFHLYPALKNIHCIFGHTPTYFLRYDGYGGIWTDPTHKDKTCIDGGCIFGGVLCALRLDDGEAFYVKSREGRKRPAIRYISPL